MTNKYLSFDHLIWENTKFEYPNMVNISTIRDGSCFFHALIMSFYEPYQKNKVDRKKFVRELRKNLANELSNTVKYGGKYDDMSGINDETNKFRDEANQKTYYETISEGNLPELSKDFPNLKLENMKKELDSSMAIDQIYNEFISNIISRDIYILNYQEKDVNAVGSYIDKIYKNRESTVILYRPGHYELVGLIEPGNILRLSFSPTHPYIMAIKKRMNVLVKT